MKNNTHFSLIINKTIDINSKLNLYNKIYLKVLGVLNND